MIIPDFIGWIANIFFIYGVYALGMKKVHGFYYNSIANLFYIVQGILLGVPSLAILSLALIGLNIKGIIEWRKND